MISIFILFFYSIFPFPFFFVFEQRISFKRIVEYTADEHNGFNAVVRREPVDAKLVKKVYEPEFVKQHHHHHLQPIGPVPVAAPLKYYSAHQQQPSDAAIYAPPAPIPVQKVYAPATGAAAILHHQKVRPQPFIAPQQYYAPPENPKFFRPAERVQKFYKPAHEYESQQHTGVKYVSSSPSHYNHY